VVVAQVLVEVDPTEVETGLQGAPKANPLDVEDVAREGGSRDLHEPMPQQPVIGFDNLVGGVGAVDEELQ